MLQWKYTCDFFYEAEYNNGDYLKAMQSKIKLVFFLILEYA